MTEENLEALSLDKLLRKRDQAWELAGCARQDGDNKDEIRWTVAARKYAAEIAIRSYRCPL